MRIAIDFIIICNLLFSICYLDKRLCSLPKQGCLSGLLVVSGICSLSGNAGTGTYQRGAEEHGCDFAPFAIYKRIISKFLEPLAAGVVFAMGEQKAHPVKAAVRHLHYHFPFRSHHNNKCKGE
mgnify:CR=1 FL=1